jgi:hypothetical protein
MQAPTTAGTYREDWRLTDPAATTINVSGSATIWAQIRVQ